MKITGEHRLPRPPEVVWAWLHDVDVLSANLPGCNELLMEDASTFSGSATVGIGPIKGLYQGRLELQEEREPTEAQVRLHAHSSHAEIRGEGHVSLEPAGDGTLLHYEGEAHISGRLAAVGQRLLPSAARSIADSFFKNLESALGEEASA